MNGIQQREHTTRVGNVERELRDTQELTAASLEALSDQFEAFRRESRLRDESTRADIGIERTHRLKLADEQRAYVDSRDASVARSLAAFTSMRFWLRLRWLATGRS